MAAEVYRRGAVLAVVVGHQDERKRALLTSAGYSLASEWHLSDLGLADDLKIASDGEIRCASPEDLASVVELCEQRRAQYQEYQPIFWRTAPDAREKQRPLLERTLRNVGNVALVHAIKGIAGAFVIG